MNISVIGLGKLGAPLAASLAAAGHQVVGVDRAAEVLHAMRQQRPLVHEPGLPELLAQVAGRLSLTDDVNEAVRSSEVTFVAVPTPSKRNGAFSLKYVVPALRSIGQALQGTARYQVVVLVSTVMPGATAGKVKDVLEQASGKRCGPDFGLCYNPEFIALGNVLADLANPDLVLIGESDPRAGDRLIEVLKPLWRNAPALRRMAFANAELAKLAINTFVTAKISFANLLGELCEGLDGGDVDHVTEAVGLDRRIGPRYLRAGLGYGGPCFPRDNRALTALAQRLNVRASLPRASDRINGRQVARLQRLVLAKLPARGKVGILGLAYKPNTPVLERAQGLELARALQAAGVPVMVHDPLISRQAPCPFEGQFRIADSPLECARKVDLLVLCTPCPEFKAIEQYRFEPTDFRSLTVIDCWRLLNAERLAPEIEYITLGRQRRRAEGSRFERAPQETVGY